MLTGKTIAMEEDCTNALLPRNSAILISFFYSFGCFVPDEGASGQLEGKIPPSGLVQKILCLSSIVVMRYYYGHFVDHEEQMPNCFHPSWPGADHCPDIGDSNSNKDDGFGPPEWTVWT
eukprot:scaffold90024_cov54-Attheya_sp.AAC.1